MEWVGVYVADEWALHERWQLTAGARFTAYNKITQVLTGDVDASGRLIVQSQNATQLTLKGVEAGALWAITPRTSLCGTATWTWGQEEFEAQTYPADRIPPLFGKLVARFLLGTNRTLESSLYWAGEQDRLSPRDEVDPRINPEGTAAWATIRARLVAAIRGPRDRTRRR